MIIGWNSPILQVLSSSVLKRFLLLFLLLASAAGSYASIPDSLFIADRESWVLHHQVRPGETVYSVARRYHVPVSALAKANDLRETDPLNGISTLTIPLGEHNVLTLPPAGKANARPLYYRVVVGDNLFQLSSRAGVSPELLTLWNGTVAGGLRPGRALLVGWVRYDRASVEAGEISVIYPDAVPKPVDTAEMITFPEMEEPPKAAVPPLEREWNEQTVDGQNVVTEKGTVGFFNINASVSGADVYAFHNAAARGTIMRVRNINNDRSIFVKVLGPLPETKQYAGCVLGLSDGAKAALGVQENKAFCEMSYAGY